MRAGPRTAWAVSMIAACTASDPPPPDTSGVGGSVVQFVAASGAYRIQPPRARLGQLDDRVSLGSITDILVLDDRIFVADGLDPRIVAFDWSLNPVRASGREGDGPGEFRFPRRLTAAGERRLAVLDPGMARVSYFDSSGEFNDDITITANASDIAHHRSVGLLVSGDVFPSHYLLRIDSTGSVPFGIIPENLQERGGVPRELERVLPRHRNLVTVATDGRIYVLDQQQLALVAYESTGEIAETLLFPHALRERELQEANEAAEALGDRLISIEIASELRPLDDGRLFVRMTSGDTLGYVLDPGTRQATPLLTPVGPDWTWMRRGTIGAVNMRQLVIGDSWEAELHAAEIRFLEAGRF
ncbi:MAG: 6-bladed beta-propeller [Gemmatimonadales bacterium]|nr:6-bladed beta-propeller [Gemmatimonadales bacterium]MYG48318.1 6-bladed beta-propeller [Gemmatimonadales bacterium]MYK01584.1 6-bladed beta-propeller [Candidatus Palauibacter ramosifaciens]